MKKRLKAIKDDTDEIIEGVVHLPEDCKPGDLVEFKYVRGEFVGRVIAPLKNQL